MVLSIYASTRILFICSMLLACGNDESKLQSLQDRFEAIYGYTDCKEVVLGTGLTQPTWITVFQTYSGGYLDQKETTFLDETCKTSFTSVNRWATYQILSSPSEDTGEIKLAINTRRILSLTSDEAPPEMQGIPRVNCNSEMAGDLRKEECKTYFDATGFVTRYVTLNLTPEGLQPFKDIDTAGTTEETRSTDLAPYTLSVLNPIDN
ncbi:hypothetical protein [Oligoflexus tunisiensis]|uniref:hypothetical protein n=1 Tax=Oligoflexus tunisiensis TaxID=708132 RepID=UPI00114C9EC9|nr:hypothetical protein [Oligoflexus tunisiensis]